MAALSSRAFVAGLAGLLALGGCSGYDDGYGYGGVSVGYYGGNYYDPWYDGYYGWYDGFYYPGRGYYIYDRQGKRHRWNEHHRRHWEARRERGVEHRDGRRDDRPEWRDGRRDDRRGWRSEQNGERNERRTERRSQQSERVAGPTRTRREAIAPSQPGPRSETEARGWRRDRD